MAARGRHGDTVFTNSGSLHEGSAKVKSKARNSWKERYVTLIPGLLTQPSILLIFKNSAKQKMKMYAEVHGVSVKSNADDIRVDDSGNQIFIRVDTAKEHIRWIAVLKSAITKCVHIPVKHYGLDDDEYSLLHVEDRTYSDNTFHHLIVLSSPYDDIKIRHCWDSLEVKQLRAVQEGVFLDFCPHCSKSVTFVKLGFTLRLPQIEIESCLDFFCQHTSAKRKKDQKYICEMTTHSILCTHSPPVHPAPNPPPVPTGVNAILYNISDVLFRPSLSRASRSRLDTAVPPPTNTSQREPPHYVNQESYNQLCTNTQGTSSPDVLPSQPQLGSNHVSTQPPITPRRRVPGNQSQFEPQQNGAVRQLHRQGSSGTWPRQRPVPAPRRDSNNQPSTTTDQVPGLGSEYIAMHSPIGVPGQPQLENSHANNRPPITPRRRVPAGNQPQPELHQDLVRQLRPQRSSGTWPRQRPSSSRRGIIVDHVCKEADTPISQDDETRHTGITQYTSATDVNVCGNEELQENLDESNIENSSVVDHPREPVHNETSLPATVMEELQATVTPNVISIPMTDRRNVSPLSVSVYRKRVMNTTSSYSDDSSSVTLPAHRTKRTQNENFTAIHNALQCTVFFQHT